MRSNASFCRLLKIKAKEFEDLLFRVANYFLPEGEDFPTRDFFSFVHAMVRQAISFLHGI